MFRTSKSARPLDKCSTVLLFKRLLDLADFSLSEGPISLASGPHMPPKKGIVQSGNAGNSPKASKVQKDKTRSAEGQTSQTVDKPAPLFPPGFKYPLSLLNERSVKPQTIPAE